MEDLEVMKTRFNERVNRIKMDKGKNHQLFTRDEYYTFLTKVKASKNKTSHKTPEDYQRLARYDTVQIGSVEKLVVPVKNERDQIIYYTYLEEIFDIVHETHISIGHGGRNRMIKELKSKYKNITKELTVIYLDLCQPCQKKLSIPKKDWLLSRSKATSLIQDVKLILLTCNHKQMVILNL